MGNRRWCLKFGYLPCNYLNSQFGYGSISRFDTPPNYVGERERSEEKMWIGEVLVRKDRSEPVPERWLLNASLTFRDVFVKGPGFQISGFKLLDDEHRDPEVNG